MSYFVELEPHSPRIELLCLIYEGLQGLTLWTEPQTIIHQLCIPTNIEGSVGETDYKENPRHGIEPDLLQFLS